MKDWVFKQLHMLFSTSDLNLIFNKINIVNISIYLVSHHKTIAHLSNFIILVCNFCVLTYILLILLLNWRPGWHIQELNKKFIGC